MFVCFADNWVIFHFSNSNVLTMHNVGWESIFFVMFFSQNEMYCIFCPVSRNVSEFFSSDTEFYLVFKHVCLHMFLTGKLSMFPLSAGLKKMAASFL